MRLISLISIFLVSVSIGCGKAEVPPAPPTPPPACLNSSVLGVWYQADALGQHVPEGDKLTLNADCSGTSQACKASFTFENSASASAQIIVNVLTVGNPGGRCLPVGKSSCKYLRVGSTLTFDCGDGNSFYTLRKPK